MKYLTIFFGIIFCLNIIGKDITLPDTIRINIHDFKRRNPVPTNICFNLPKDTAYLISSTVIHSYLSVEKIGYALFEGAWFIIESEKGKIYDPSPIYGCKLPKPKAQEQYEKQIGVVDRGILEISNAHNCFDLYFLFGQYYGYLDRGIYNLYLIYHNSNDLAQILNTNSGAYYNDFFEKKNVSSDAVLVGTLISNPCKLIIY